MSIWIRKKQARAKAAQETKKRSARHPRPALEALSLPEDVAGNSVRVILMGNDRALIENLLGVADIGKESIRLTTRAGLMTFHGQELYLTDVRAGAAAVTGRIETVELPREKAEEAGGDD